jgi:fluoride exporter
MPALLVDCLFVGAGGALGTVSRYLFSLLPIEAPGGLPLTTLLINCLGAFVLGTIMALVSCTGGIDARLLLFLKVGVCGGFTTFSTFSLESAQLLQNNSYPMAIAYVVASVVVCIICIFASQWIVESIMARL